jgi:hypothetical protein
VKESHVTVFCFQFCLLKKYVLGLIGVHDQVNGDLEATTKQYLVLTKRMEGGFQPSVPYMINNVACDQQ